MHTRLIALLAVLVAALGATAVPAFTADSGTVTLSVTAQAPAAPCLEINTTNIDFGTQPFSQPNNPISPLDGFALRNCGQANEHVAAAGTDAVGAQGAWTLTSQLDSAGPCQAGVDKYALNVGGLGDISVLLANTPQLLGFNSAAHVFEPSPTFSPLGVRLFMPCQGSNGAGETKTFSASFTAVLS